MGGGGGNLIVVALLFFMAQNSVWLRFDVEKFIFLMVYVVNGEESQVNCSFAMGDLGSKATRWQWHRSLLNQNIYVKFIFIQCIL